MITTTKAKASQYTRREYEKVIQARKLQTIIMHPGTREMSDIAIKHLLKPKSDKVRQTDCRVEI